MDSLLNTKKADGSSPSLGSAKREAVIVRAIINHGIREFDIDSVSNRLCCTNRLGVELPFPQAGLSTSSVMGMPRAV